MARGNWYDKVLNAEDLKAISAAVTKAEKQTNVEIIPVLEKSAAAGLGDIYYLKLLKAVLAFIPSLTLTFFFSSVVFRLYDLWWNPIYFQILSLLVLYAIFYYLFWYFPYPILPKGLYQIFAYAKVKNDFSLTKEFQTKKKESFLIYGFLREHLVILYGDKKIFNRLDEERIAEFLDVYIQNAKAKNMQTAFTDTIHAVTGDLAKEFPKTECDEDEVKNQLHLKDT